MTIASCPKCTDQVTMPMGVGREATVRCPLCHEEFKLAEVLDKLPPALIVLDAGPLPAHGAFPAAATVTEDEYAMAAVDEGAEFAGAKGFVVQRGAAVVTREEAAGARRRGRARSRKPKNALVEGVKIVLGGLAGLAIGQLILWWLPWDQYRRDPAKIGPKVARYAAWLVPEKFRGTEKPRTAEGEASSTIGDSSETGRQAAGSERGKDKTSPPRWPGLQPSESKNGKSETPAAKKSRTPPKPRKSPKETDLDQLEEPAEGRGKEDMPEEPSGNPASIPELQSADLKMGPLPVQSVLDLPPVELSPVGKEATKPDAPKKPGAAQPKAKPESPTARRVARPATAPAALKQALAEAEDAATAWAAAEKPDAEASSSAYEALTELAEAIAFAEQVDQATTDALRRLLESLADKPALLRAIAQAGPQWLKSEDRTNDGVVLIAVVQKTEQQGGLFETVLRLAGGEQAVLLSDRDPAALYKTDARVLVLGGIVDDPAGTITGFAGSAQRVVWAGHCQVLP